MEIDYEMEAREHWLLVAFVDKVVVDKVVVDMVVVDKDSFVEDMDSFVGKG